MIVYAYERNCGKPTFVFKTDSRKNKDLLPIAIISSARAPECAKCEHSYRHTCRAELGDISFTLPKEEVKGKDGDGLLKLAAERYEAARKKEVPQP